MSNHFIEGPRGMLPMQCAEAEKGVDGDTLDAKILGESDTSRVRVCGINAWEMEDYGSKPKGDGLAATLEVRRILDANPHVHLSSRDPNAVTGDRLKRYVDVQLPGSSEWIDLGYHLTKLGLVRFLAQADEYDRNLQYAQAQRAAMKSGLGMWASLGTGVGAFCTLTVDYSGAESVKIKNNGTVELDLTGFWLCDGMTRSKSGSKFSGRGYEFAKGTKIPSKKTLTLKVGPGKDSVLTKYWDEDTLHIFDNPSGAPTWISDGVYLGNPSGQIILATVYPDLSTSPEE